MSANETRAERTGQFPMARRLGGISIGASSRPPCSCRPRKTLNVFRGKNTAHMVSTVRGTRQRIIAVFSYFERPGVVFSREEQIGFYGRAR